MLNAHWIHCKEDIGDRVPLYKRSFSPRNTLRAAFLYISSRGVYEATLNGRRVGDFILAPGWTSYEHRIQYQKYDITDLISENNDLTVAVASGWYRGGIAKWWSYSDSHVCALIAKIELVYDDGTIECIYTDTDWKASLSGYEFCDIYGGFSFDARVDNDFCLETVIDQNDSKAELVEQLGEKVIEHERIKPIGIIETPKGERVIDFGQNMTGYVEISIDAKSGDEISLSFGEVLDREGNFYNENYRSAKSTYTYICKDGEQTFKPTLTFYGYRFVRVDSYPGELNADNFTSIAVYSDIKRTGYVETSNPLLNRFLENVVWGQRSNFLDVPTDCPQRDERMGWTGDAQAFVRAACCNYDVNKFFEKWLGDMVLDQLPSGAVPMVIPYEKAECSVSAAWSDAIAICPWQLYLSYGNTEILKKMFLPIKKWVDYITSTTTKPNLWFGGDHYCDWLELGAKQGQFIGDTRGDLIGSAFYARSVEILCKAGRIIGEDVSDYELLYGRIIDAFNSEFEGTYKTQTEHALALIFNITKDPKSLARSLADLIHKDGVKLQTGFVGTPYILHALSRYGYSELAYTLLLREDYPSWLYPVTKGATTVWEHWDGIMPDGEMWSSGMNSFNHYAYGAVIDWIYATCGGINPIETAPGYEKVLIAPIADKRLEWLSVELQTAHGTISSSWRHEKDKTVYKISTPVSATVVIEGKTYELCAGSYTF